jgi:DNA-binding GntR family transcriptional regulator
MTPGSRIVEKGLCAEMQVSRTPLREALNRLALEDLVVLMPFRGYITSPISVDRFRELCELRRILESESAALAAKRATAEDVKKLERLAVLRYTRTDPQSYENYLRANSAFHQALAGATRNTMLKDILMSSLDHHQRPLYLGLGVGVDAKASTAEHFEVVEAIRGRDARRARAVMINHIARAETRIVSALQTAGY